MSDEPLRIKDWELFQHFKDRRPPWIKLYRDLLDDPEWHFLDAESAKILVMLWLIASEDKTGCGNLPKMSVLCFRLRADEKTLKKTLIKLSHWLVQDDINLISERYHDGPPETETETETEERREETEKIEPSAQSPSEKFFLLWNVFAGEVGLQKCEALSDGRKKALNARLKDKYWKENYALALEKMRSIVWIRGNDSFPPRGIDWFLKTDTVAKVMEGAHDDRDFGKPKTFDEKRDLYQAPEGYDGPFA